MVAQQSGEKRAKDAVSFIGAYEDAIVRYAGKFHVEGVLCGHIHSPVVRQIGSTTYYNCGDWVENCSALVELDDGRIELLTHCTALQAAEPAPPPRGRRGLNPQEHYEKEIERAPGAERRDLSRTIVDCRSR